MKTSLFKTKNSLNIFKKFFGVELRGIEPLCPRVNHGCRAFTVAP